MEALLTAHLLAWTALVAAVAAPDGARIDWERLPKRESVPAVILHGGSSIGRRYTMRGRVGLTGYFVQIDCWAATKAEAIALRALVIPAIDALKDRPLQAFIERDHNGWDAAPAPDPARLSDLYRASLDVRLEHTETP